MKREERVNLLLHCSVNGQGAAEQWGTEQTSVKVITPSPKILQHWLLFPAILLSDVEGRRKGTDIFLSLKAMGSSAKKGLTSTTNHTPSARFLEWMSNRKMKLLQLFFFPLLIWSEEGNHSCHPKAVHQGKVNSWKADPHICVLD